MKKAKKVNEINTNGGGGGIRTHGTISRTPVFKTGALNRSATPPHLHEADVNASLSLSNSSVNLPLDVILD